MKTLITILGILILGSSVNAQLLPSPQPNERGEIFIYDTKGNLTIGEYRNYGRDAWTIGPKGYTSQHTDKRGNIDVWSDPNLTFGDQKGDEDD